MSDGWKKVGVGVCAFALYIAGIAWIFNRDDHSPYHRCSTAFGTATREHALCVYELEQGLRTEP